MTDQQNLKWLAGCATGQRMAGWDGSSVRVELLGRTFDSARSVRVSGDTEDGGAISWVGGRADWAAALEASLRG